MSNSNNSLIPGSKGENIVASIIRFSSTTWVLVAYPKLSKSISRDEGLRIKNEFKLEPYSAHGVSLGYRGIVPKSLFNKVGVIA